MFAQAKFLAKLETLPSRAIFARSVISARSHSASLQYRLSGQISLCKRVRKNAGWIECVGTEWGPPDRRRGEFRPSEEKMPKVFIRGQSQN